MEKNYWNNIKKELVILLDIIRNHLDGDSIDAVEHYIKHDEFEIAFEGLFIEIMKMEKAPNLDYNIYLKLGKKLKLDEESVIDPFFWENFINFIRLSKSSNLEE